MTDRSYTPSDFVALFNQTLEYAYPSVVLEGELANFRISKNRWVYFDLKDEMASVAYFGSIYQLPGPLSDGMVVRVVGSPRLHPLFGFSLSFQSIMPVGQGSLKKAADLLLKKLQTEGLFAEERKRPLPYAPTTIGLITAGNSAAYADFIKILGERWGGMEIRHIDTLVQGEKAPLQLAGAVEHFNGLNDMPEVLVMTRGGGGPDDLAAFNDERVVRAVAASRIPTLVAVGHEIDTSLAEMAADMRASTPSSAAQILVPDKKNELANLKSRKKSLNRAVLQNQEYLSSNLKLNRDNLNLSANNWLAKENERLRVTAKLLELFNPDVALQRGYALLSKKELHISSVSQVGIGDSLNVKLQDGTIRTKVTSTEKTSDD